MRLFRKTNYLRGVSVRKTTKSRKYRLFARPSRFSSFANLRPSINTGLVGIIGVIIAAFALSTAGNTQSVYAAGLVDTMTPTQQAASYEYYYALSSCMKTSPLTDGAAWESQGDRINVKNAQSGQWFYDNASFKDAGAYIGQPSATVGPYLAKEGLTSNTTGSNPNSIIGCGNSGLVTKALSLWNNWSYDSALCSFGFQRAADDQKDRCLASDGGNDNFEKVNGNVQSPFNDAVQKRVYGGSAPTLSDNAKYLLYLGTFTATCANGAQILQSAPSGSTNKDYKVTIASGAAENATPLTQWYVGRLDISYTKDSSIPISAKSGDSMTCAQLADAISKLAEKYVAYVVQGGSNDTGGVAGDGSSEDPDNGESSCKIAGGVGWLVCPVSRFAADTADGLYRFVSDTFLSTNYKVVSTTGGTYTAWQALLAIANVIFVILFLLIIFSQATGYGISNYGIKKILPRLILGVVFINLSFFICQLAVDAANILGNGIISWRTSIFGESHPITWSSIVSQMLAGSAVTAGGTVVLVGGAIALVTGFGLTALLAVVLTLVFIVLFLIARQVLIILCVVLSPIAFAAWLLPNTEKFFKQWWKIFFAMLIVYPLTSLIVALSGLASSVITDSVSNSNTLLVCETGTDGSVVGDCNTEKQP